MNINKQAWHYKIYKGTYVGLDKRVPSQTNLCQYVRRTFFFSWIFYLMFGLARLFFFGVLTPFAALIGKIPSRKYRYNQLVPGWGFRDYTGFRVGSMELHLWMILVPLLFLGLNAFWIACVCNYGIHALFSVLFLLIECSILGVASYFIFFEGTLDETTSVIWAWFSAKKQKICPLIEFSDKLPTDCES